MQSVERQHLKWASLTALPLQTEFLLSPFKDIFLILFAPWIGLLLSYIFFAQRNLFFWHVTEENRVVTGFFLSRVLIQSHIVVVFLRSHLRPLYITRYPFRMIAVPFLLLAIGLLSDNLLFWMVILGGFWDLYHSAMQNFGILRIYNQKSGNSPTSGRTLDIMISLFLYLGAIIAGINFIPSLENSFILNGKHHWAWTNYIKTWTISYYQPIQESILILAAIFLIAYLIHNICQIKKGGNFSLLKWVFLFNTTAVTLYAWTRMPFFFALFVVNFYHAIQYHAIVWHSEKNQLISKFRMTRIPLIIPLILFLFFALAYGLCIVGIKGNRLVFCVGITFSILHYWYDGFIWSVRKNEV